MKIIIVNVKNHSKTADIIILCISLAKADILALTEITAHDIEIELQLSRIVQRQQCC